MRAQEFNTNPGESKARFIEMFKKFLPLCMHYLELNSLPKIVFKKSIDDLAQPTFGMYVNGKNTLFVALANRHPNDILRTVAHELQHYKQDTQHRLDDTSGETGSPIENEAHAMAGIVMRHFNKRYPEYLKDRPVIAEGKIRESVDTIYDPADPEPWLKDPAMAAARTAGQSYTDPQGRHYSFGRDLSGRTDYQGLRKPKNIPGVNIFPAKDIVGQRVYHCTDKLEQIKKTGGLKPKFDRTGEQEYGRLTSHSDLFIPVIAIWFSTERPNWPGKNCVSWVIEPGDKLAVAYAKGSAGSTPNVQLNPVSIDRLKIER